MRTICLLLIFGLQQNIYSQDKNVDARATSIPEVNAGSVDSLISYIRQNFSTEEDKIRSIYVWIANHINYDVQKMLHRKDNPNSPLQTVTEVLGSKNAVCQGYSDLFAALCKGVGIKAIVIPGYTKRDGKVAPISHAWVAAMLDNGWYLFDPTWGAGYVRDDRFVRKFNNSFYKSSPTTFILDHMPFDPVFQFLPHPLNNKEFIEGLTPPNKTFFSYKDTLKLYEQLSTIQQNAAELRRLEGIGIQNNLLQERQLFLKNRLQSFASKNSYDEGARIFNGILGSYRGYINHKNKQFTSIGDNDLTQFLDSMINNTKLARSYISEAVTKTENQSETKINTLANVDKFWLQLDKEKQFVDKYIATKKEDRRQFFLKK